MQTPPPAPRRESDGCESSNLRRMQETFSAVQLEQDALLERAHASLSVAQLRRMLQDKIRAHTRNDKDVVRKIFNAFNDGRDNAGDDAEESGINEQEFARACRLHFNLPLDEAQYASLFAGLDEDGSGVITARELAHAMCPNGFTQKPWYSKREEATQRKIANDARMMAKRGSCASPATSANPRQLMQLIRDKITQHTRSDQDRVRKIFNVFNDGHDEEGAEEHGIDVSEFQTGLMMHFGVTLSADQSHTVFKAIDADGSGVITAAELAQALFPATASSVRL